MHVHKLTFRSILAIGFIFICTAAGWFILGGALTHRSMDRSGTMEYAVVNSWGPQLEQAHPVAWYESPAHPNGRSVVYPSQSDVQVELEYDPQRKGLFWYRTYATRFEAHYMIPNNTPIEQTVFVSFELPSSKASYNEFAFELGESDAKEEPLLKEGSITQAVVVPAKSSVPLTVRYHARGLNRWDYSLGDAERVQQFKLRMVTDFESIDFPAGSGSPTDRSEIDGGWSLVWDYPDVIGAQSIAMDMPKILNPGPVASRISFFAPVSLLFFFAVLLIFGSVRGMNLHPMNYFFLAAGCFAFQLLFAYTVDIMPIHVCFILSAGVSLVLVGCYLNAVGGRKLARIALSAQFVYMVLFSYSFFFDGLSGLTIAVGAVATLGVLMAATAKTNWSEVFVSRKHAEVIPPRMPAEVTGA